MSEIRGGLIRLQRPFVGRVLGKEQDMQVQSDGTQDRIEQHTSDRAKKSKKKKILIISGVVIVIVLFLGLLLPSTGRITPATAMRVRCGALTGWHKYVKLYIEENNLLPNSLFEVSEDANSKGNRPIPAYLTISNDGFQCPAELTIIDPNLFEKEVPYGLFTGSKRWFIRELKAGRLYKNMLMIDQDGKIYEIREIPKEKYRAP
jgi:hypothetical protein